MKILLGSESEIKKRAIEKSVGRGVNLIIKQIKTNSKISEQPHGYTDIIRGCENRMNDLLEYISNNSFYYDYLTNNR